MEPRRVAVLVRVPLAIKKRTLPGPTSTTNLKLSTLSFLAVLLGVAALVNAPAVTAAAAGGLDLRKGTTTAAQLPQTQWIRDFSDQTLAKIIPGQTTKAGVEASLGKPWRDTQLDEEDVMPGDPSVEVWEYRGRGSQGTYRVHIQFDKSDLTTLIAKIPEKTGKAVARVAEPTVNPRKER
jgi:hypothetical protein